MNVYLITNNVNGKIYIGKDESNSKKKYDNYYGSGKLIIRAIHKYGKNNFTKKILFETTDKIELSTKEKYFIELYQSQNIELGYNITKGGDGGQVQSNEELSIVAKKLWENEEYRNKQSVSRKGRSVWNAGKTNLYSLEYIEKLKK